MHVLRCKLARCSLFAVYCLVLDGTWCSRDLETCNIVVSLPPRNLGATRQMGRSSATTAAVAGVLLLAHGEVPQTSAFVPPTAVGALQRPPSWHHSTHSPRVREASSLAGHRRQGGAAASSTRTPAGNNCNLGGSRGRSSSSIPTCCVASSSSGDDAGAGPSTASPSPGAVASAAVVEESKERKGGGGVPEKVQVGRNGTWGGGGGLIPIPVAAAAETAAAGDGGEAGAASGVWGVAERSLESGLEWESDAGAAWTEFEDWLVQDTYSRYDRCRGLFGSTFRLVIAPLSRGVPSHRSW